MKYLKILLFGILISNLMLFAEEKTQNNVTFTMDAIPTLTAQAFYNGQGFSEQQIKPYTNTCVFTVTLKNINKNDQIHFKRTNWFALKDGKKYFIKDTAYWFEKFKNSNITMSQKIGFRFAQIPEEQTYEPNGDWNRGMLSVNIPHKSVFDFTINWDIKGKQHELTIKNISCAQ